MVIASIGYQFNRTVIGIGTWLLNPHGYLLIGCNHYLSDVIHLQLSDQSLIPMRHATSIIVKAHPFSPLLDNTCYCLHRASSLVLIQDPFIGHLLFEQPLGLSGSGTNLAHSSSFTPIPFLLCVCICSNTH